MQTTARQREVMLLVARGLSNKETARRLGITEGTVKIHLHKIYGRLGIRNRTALVALAHKTFVTWAAAGWQPHTD